MITKNNIEDITHFLKKNKIIFEKKINKILDKSGEKIIVNFIWYSKDRLKKKTNLINFHSDGTILIDLIPLKNSNLDIIQKDKRIFKNFKMGEKKIFNSYGYDSLLLDEFYKKSLGNYYDIIFKN